MDAAIHDEKLYYNTMPQSVYNSKKAQENLNKEKLMKFEQSLSNMLGALSIRPLPRPRLSKKKFSDKEGGFRREFALNIPHVGQRSLSIAANQIDMKRLQYIQDDVYG